MQRVVGYIYHYSEDKNVHTDDACHLLTKCGNTGFCRVENSEDKYKVTICFKEVCCINEECKIYNLKKYASPGTGKSCYKKSDILEKREIRNGQLSCRLEVEKQDGMLIECSNKSYIVIWKSIEENIFLKNEMDDRAVENQSPKENRAVVNQNKTEDRAVLNQNKTENRAVSNQNKIEGYNTEKNTQPQMEKLITPLDRAFNHLCKVRMIIDNKECQAVKLRPQEFIILPRKYWRLANNCFLMDSYYMSGSIFFFKNRGNYVIAVPGRGCKNEEVYARRFGFTEKVMGYEYGKKDRERVYWMMNLTQ